MPDTVLVTTSAFDVVVVVVLCQCLFRFPVPFLFVDIDRLDFDPFHFGLFDRDVLQVKIRKVARRIRISA